MSQDITIGLNLTNAIGKLNDGLVVN